jgi:hypothetical protein
MPYQKVWQTIIKTNNLSTHLKDRFFTENYNFLLVKLVFYKNSSYSIFKVHYYEKILKCRKWKVNSVKLTIRI